MTRASNDDRWPTCGGRRPARAPPRVGAVPRAQRLATRLYATNWGVRFRSFAAG